jgi:hypothetical protein
VRLSPMTANFTESSRLGNGREDCPNAAAAATTTMRKATVLFTEPQARNITLRLNLRSGLAVGRGALGRFAWHDADEDIGIGVP